jgi:hypothetical protein
VKASWPRRAPPDDDRVGAVLAIAEAHCTLERKSVTLLHRHLALAQSIEGFLEDGAAAEPFERRLPRYNI